jgi:hypothetical protein
MPVRNENKTRPKFATSFNFAKLSIGKTNCWKDIDLERSVGPLKIILIIFTNIIPARTWAIVGGCLIYCNKYDNNLVRTTIIIKLVEANHNLKKKECDSFV